MSTVTSYTNIHLSDQNSSRIRDMSSLKTASYCEQCEWKSEWFNKNTVTWIQERISIVLWISQSLTT